MKKIYLNGNTKEYQQEVLKFKEQIIKYFENFGERLDQQAERINRFQRLVEAAQENIERSRNELNKRTRKTDYICIPCLYLIISYNDNLCNLHEIKSSSLLNHCINNILVFHIIRVWINSIPIKREPHTSWSLALSLTLRIHQLFHCRLPLDLEEHLVSFLKIGKVKINKLVMR